VATVLGYVRDIFIILTAVGGFIFAIYRFVKNREAAANLQIDLILNVCQVSSTNLASVTISIKNLGKAAAYVPPEKTKEAICSVRKIPSVLGESQVTWEHLEASPLVSPMLYFADWDTYYPDEPFIFEPGSVDSYLVSFSTQYHGPIWIRAEIIDKDDYAWRADRICVLP